MAESKRIFNRGRMNRDIDDRLLPEGEYRDALNVNVGESEGGDIGAVENLKGNELISGQDGIGGNTLAAIKDEDENNIYWITSHDDPGGVDAVHEYDVDTGAVRTLITEPKSRGTVELTCAPELVQSITSPDTLAFGARGTTVGLPTAPQGYCADTSASNFGQRSDGSNATIGYDFSQPSLCTFPPADIFGCTDNTADNFDPTATMDDGSCTFGGTTPTTGESYDCSTNTWVTLGTSVSGNTVVPTAVSRISTATISNLVWNADSAPLNADFTFILQSFDISDSDPAWDNTGETLTCTNGGSVTYTAATFEYFISALSASSGTTNTGNSNQANTSRMFITIDGGEARASASGSVVVSWTITMPFLNYTASGTTTIPIGPSGRRDGWVVSHSWPSTPLVPLGETVTFTAQITSAVPNSFNGAESTATATHTHDGPA